MNDTNNTSRWIVVVSRLGEYPQHLEILPVVELGEICKSYKHNEGRQ